MTRKHKWFKITKFFRGGCAVAAFCSIKELWEKKEEKITE